MYLSLKHITKLQTGKKTIPGLKAFAIVFCLILISAFTLNAQVIHNNGAVVNVQNGIIITTDTLNNAAGNFINDGNLQIDGDYYNAANANGNGYYNITGNWSNSGIFNPGNSTVELSGTNNQDLRNSGSGSFYYLLLNNTGPAASARIRLLNNISILNTLEMNEGIINSNGNILSLNNNSSASLVYGSATGSRIIGKFQRALNSTDQYFFPLGSEDNFNPLYFESINNPTPGNLISEFTAAPPVDVNLPIPDDSVEIFETYDDGYWDLQATG